MCGVIAVLAYGEFEDKKMEKVRQESMIFLASELLQLTQTRGKEATGIATLFANCDYMGLKMGISAQEFVARFGGTEKDFEGYLNIWRKKTSPAKIVVGHCRKPSTGAGSGTDDNTNNHPIKVGDIVGVHNGTLTNHENIFTNLKCSRDGKVDSEAIFRLLDHYTKGGTEPFTKEGILETCKRLDGTYACLAFNGNNPYQMVAFRDGRPLEIAIIRSLKLVLIASEKDFIKTAIFRYSKMAYLYQTGGMKFVNIKKGDFDVEVLPDDSLYLFDIRDDITMDTKITDLYTTEKVSRTDKIWKGTTKVWTAGAGYTTYTPPATTTKTPATNNTAVVDYANNSVKKTTCGTQGTGATGASTTATNRSGMVWNRVDRKYEHVGANADKAAGHGNVEIDVENGGKILSVGKSEEEVLKPGEKKEPTSTSHTGVPAIRQSPFQLDETYKPVDDLISDQAKIKVVEPKRTDTKTPVVATEPKAGIKKEVDLKAYPDVVERAKQATKDEPGFGSEEEMVDALEISNVSIMKSMSLHALANRIKSYFFGLGWEKGYITRMNEESRPDGSELARTMLVRVREKAESGKRTIKAMKTMTRILCKIATGGNSTIPERKVESTVVEMLSNGEPVDVVSLRKAYREGDIRKDPIIGVITSKLENKQGR
jgi:hypothetical protein